MTAPKTECTPQLILPFRGNLPVHITFDAPEISMNAGALILHQVEEKRQIVAQLAACLPDDRDPKRVQHSRGEQLMQRIIQIALGFEDCNDAKRLREDPILKTVCDRQPKDPGLSSQPTLSRFENAPDRRHLARFIKKFEDAYISALPRDEDVVILDIDGTDDQTHGQQEFSFFHAYYDHYMFHPLLVYDGTSGQLITALLRPGNRHVSKNATGTLRRLIKKIRKRCPQAAIVVRGDSGFCTPKLLKSLERLKRQLGHVDYLVGIAQNSRLKRYLEPLTAALRDRQIGSTKEVALTLFDYRAGSWPHSRLVIGKAEFSAMGSNPRFVLTSIQGFDAETLYRAYCERGQCENWIKDLKNALSADRLSCSRYTANFFRLLLHATAYRLMHALRQYVAPICRRLGRAQFDTLRLVLLRVAATVQQTSRRIHVRLPYAYPDAPIFHQLAASLIPPALPTPPL